MTAPSRLPETRRAKYAANAEHMRAQSSASYHRNKKLKGPPESHHTLSDKDTDAGLASCSICGQVRIKLKGQGWRCVNAIIEDGIRYHYGITGPQFRELLAKQDNACAICRRPFGDIGREVDHDHGCCSGKRACGKCVRGILCCNCNNGLGKFGDEVDRLLAAAAYLEASR